MRKMKSKYHEGPKIRDEFEHTMTALFRVPKDAVKKPEKRISKKKRSETQPKLNQD
jgi:hypothetical protein